MLEPAQIWRVRALPLRGGPPGPTLEGVAVTVTSENSRDGSSWVSERSTDAVSKMRQWEVVGL